MFWQFYTFFIFGLTAFILLNNLYCEHRLQTTRSFDAVIKTANEKFQTPLKKHYNLTDKECEQVYISLYILAFTSDKDYYDLVVKPNDIKSSNGMAKAKMDVVKSYKTSLLKILSSPYHQDLDNYVQNDMKIKIIIQIIRDKKTGVVLNQKCKEIVDCFLMENENHAAIFNKILLSPTRTSLLETMVASIPMIFGFYHTCLTLN